MGKILEETKDFIEKDMKGLATTLFFSGGVEVSVGEPKVCHEISICSNNVRMGAGNPEKYETMAFSDEHEEPVYCKRTDTEEAMLGLHLEAVRIFKTLYFNQQKQKA